MSLFCRLSRKHYWCTPHRSADDRLVQVCYECGAERRARELHTEIATEWPVQPAPQKAEQVRRAVPRAINQVPSASTLPERIAVGQDRTRRFVVVK